ncbi:MAG: hypothetical protein QM652_09450 [Legionella sp.]|uniref:hypothetical protein n=1 Tax=Legionella sp. TaxID=459 RepID=UPI0039E5E382
MKKQIRALIGASLLLLADVALSHGGTGFSGGSPPRGGFNHGNQWHYHQHFHHKNNHWHHNNWYNNSHNNWYDNGYKNGFHQGLGSKNSGYGSNINNWGADGGW